ncbi:helix-turn-helix transcriptional regulator [Inquilinus sp. Marseille-Q2685]|uniref:helix-turn-helix transcriptional regulator n=1 Tax=Inquilinus sp. Marseille-Q2685 TaxID=2866581 RepID=UPI001CE4B195|nr:helix-turn-helix transcriptional regulator [Inquilinus sp. Marseille-Q2685]
MARVTSKLPQFSQFVTDLHRIGREGDGSLPAWGFDRLRAILGFDCAWYGWARFEPGRTIVQASSTLDLPGDFARFWATIENQDLVARSLRETPGGVRTYDRGQPVQTDGMIELAERYRIRKWASAMHSRPNRTTVFFASIYRGDAAEWDDDDLHFLQGAVDHIFLAVQASQRREAAADRAALPVDPSGFAHLGLEASEGLLKSVRPGWAGERLPGPPRGLLQRPGTVTLKSEGIVVHCERDDAGGLMQLKLNAIADLDRLTRREREVALLLAAGATHKQAAQALGSAPATIRNQIQAIYEKLGIRSRAELAGAVLQGRAQASDRPPPAQTLQQPGADRA